MNFVLDNSVSMRWLLPDRSSTNQKYAEKVLAAMMSAAALVPNLWWLEVSNVLVRAERAGEITPGESARFLDLLAALPIEESNSEGSVLLQRVFPLAREYALSAYDAAYLDLAMREGMALATLDAELCRAAEATGVALYLR